MEEGELERQLRLAPPGAIRPEADVAILVVGQGGQLFRQHVGGLLVSCGRQLFRTVRNVIEPEGKCRLPDMRTCEQQECSA